MSTEGAGGEVHAESENSDLLTLIDYAINILVTLGAPWVKEDADCRSRRRNTMTNEALPEGGWPTGELEGPIAGLRNTIRVMCHLSRSKGEVDSEEWQILIDLLFDFANQVEMIWEAALKRDWAQRKAHREAIAALKESSRAAKAAPGSKEDLERAEALWTLARGLATTAIKYCAEAGYPVQTIPDERTRPQIGFGQ